MASIRKTHPQPFYDLIVPNAHHYFAEGAIHHNSGKTFITAAYGYTRWKSSAWNTSVYLSTTTGDAAQARGWGTIKDLHEKDRFRIGVRLEYRSMIVLQEDKKEKERDYRDSISVVLIKKGDNAALAAVSGRKNENVIWIIDEFPHMDVGILDARLNLLANPFSQIIGIGNKPNEGDPLYIDAEPWGDQFPDGWRSVTTELEAWRSKTGVCYYFDGEKSPNLQVPDDQPPPFKGMLSGAMIRAIEAASGGTDTTGYWTQVRGFPNQGEVTDTVLTGNLIDSFHATEEVVWNIETPKVLSGLDPGFRKEGDPCVADFAKFGPDREGKRVLMHEPETVVLRPKMSSKLPFEDQIAEAYLDEASKRSCHDLAMDVSGDGGIIAQAIDKHARLRNYRLEILLVSFSGAPDENASYEVAGERKPAKDLFDRKVSELWYSYRISVINGVIRGLKHTSRAVKQLCQRKVIMDEKKRWSVEKKKDMKKRIRRSPDDGDARVLVHAMACKKGLSGGGKVSQKEGPPKKFPDPFAKPPETPKAYQYRHAPRSLYSKR